ncbi:MAG: response regulator, partial [Clostridia bacterium]|nr:response regulator [Clostridia bacterium]
TGSVGSKADYRVSVKDTGIGMSREFAANVFDAFERERDKTVGEIQGTGLGMAITKSLVELMGGTIRVETEKGKGTEFIIDISFETAEPPTEDEIEAETDTSHFVGKRLLLVEDNAINVEIAKMILVDMGFEVDAAENGRIGYETVRDSAPGKYDAVLMDVNMPVMNGFEATEKIRKLDPPKGSVPIIAMSANAFAEDRHEAEEVGMTDYITKPIEVPELIRALNNVIKG